MAKQPQKKSSIVPAVIILVVLALTVGGMAYLYSSSQPAANVASNTNRANASSTPRTQTVPADAPPGAAPVYAKGDPSAIVTVEEFADFQCPSCAGSHPVMKEVEDAFAGNRNVRFIFRHLPLSIHDKSQEAAAAVEAAGMQGQPKFWSMMDLMLTNQQQWANASNYKEIWRGYAERIGLDVPRWENDASGMAVRGRIDLDVARARAIGVQSTPTVYINNKSIPFSDVNVPTLRRLIEAEIAMVTQPVAANSNRTSSETSNSANR